MKVVFNENKNMREKFLEILWSISKKYEIHTTDGIFSIVVFGLGIIITSLNMVYSNNYMMTLGPTLIIASVLYLRFRSKILADDNSSLHLNGETLKIINTLYWVSVSVALISYIQTFPYYRHEIFFMGIATSVAFLGLEIFSSRFEENSFKTFVVIIKILLVSLILIASAFFISPYPVGSDPWSHADLINDIYFYGNLAFPQTPTSEYYIHYPLMHIYTVIVDFMGDMDIKTSMFVVGFVLSLSTIFTYLIVKRMTGNISLALLSMLMVNFADFHIQWSIQIIAMSFGIVVYTILLYLIIENSDRHNVINTSFLIMFLCIIVWTHTVSTFVALVSVIGLYIGPLVYRLIYGKYEYKNLVNLTFCAIFVVLIIVHWADPDYPFFNSMTKSLTDSISAEAKFLGRTTIPNVGWGNILNISGFLIYIFFGIVGSLYCLSKKNATTTNISLIFMISVMFFIFFTFPIFGMRNIVPYRWPSFIYVSFVLFSGIGLMRFINILEGRHLKTISILFILFISSFFMITNFVTNVDSPFYGKGTIQKLVWTESEMALFEKINGSYDELITGDIQTIDRPFKVYLKREKIEDYRLTLDGDIDWNYTNSDMIIWRKISLKYPLQVSGYRSLAKLLGSKFMNSLDNTLNDIYDTGEARAYLKISR